MTRAVSFGSKKIVYELRYSKRATFAVTVQGGRRVIVRAPAGMASKQVDTRVLRRGAWVMRQLRRSVIASGAVRNRRYVSGSSHYLFGRELRLRVRKSYMTEVSVESPFLRVWAPNVSEASIERVVRPWRLEKARQRLLLRMTKLAPRVLARGSKLPRVRVVSMRRRWGSCSRSGTISFNPWLSEHPIGCIDYVVLHELCHLKHMHHGPAFTNLLTRLLPDWKRWKRRLDEADRG